jgi:hypothetical protein
LIGHGCDRWRVNKDVQLPVLSHFRAVDPLPARVLNQVLLGVSTRGYQRSPEAVPTARARGTSKSAASRHLVSRMGTRMRDHLMRKLDDVQVKALVMDGVLVARHTQVDARQAARLHRHTDHVRVGAGSSCAGGLRPK